MVKEIAIGLLTLKVIEGLIIIDPIDKMHNIKHCQFNENLTEDDFAGIAKSCAKKIKRIEKCWISGPQIKCRVCSQSGNSTWDFSLNFNSYGHINGRYWIKAENEDSNIPERLAQMIQQKIYCS